MESFLRIAEIDYITGNPRINPEISFEEIDELFKNKFSFYFKLYYNFNTEYIFEGVNFINGKFIVVLFDVNIELNLITVKDVRKANRNEIERFLES